MVTDRESQLERLVELQKLVEEMKESLDRAEKNLQKAAEMLEKRSRQ
jgi:hypothetical protein